MDVKTLFSADTSQSPIINLIKKLIIILSGKKYKVAVVSVSLILVVLSVIGSVNLVSIKKSYLEIKSINSLTYRGNQKKSSVKDLTNQLIKQQEEIEKIQLGYHPSPDEFFYTFAKNITTQAKQFNLKVLRSSVQGKSPTRKWELSITGSIVELSRYLENLYLNDYLIDYSSVSIRKKRNGLFDLRLSVSPAKKPEVKTLKEKDQKKTKNSSQTIPIRLKMSYSEPESISKLFLKKSVQKKNYNLLPTHVVENKIKKIPPTKTKTTYPIEIIGRYFNTEGTEVFALKDKSTGRIRQLKIGQSVLGWTLVSKNNGLTIDINGEIYYIKTEGIQ